MYNRNFYKKYVLLDCETRGFGLWGRIPAGTSSLEIKNGKAAISLVIQGLVPKDVGKYNLYLIFNSDKGFLGKDLGEVPLSGAGSCRFKYNIDPNNILNTGFRAEDIKAAAVILKDDKYNKSNVICPLCGYFNEKFEWRKTFSEIGEDISINNNPGSRYIYNTEYYYEPAEGASERLEGNRRIKNRKPELESEINREIRTPSADPETNVNSKRSVPEAESETNVNSKRETTESGGAELEGNRGRQIIEPESDSERYINNENVDNLSEESEAGENTRNRYGNFSENLRDIEDAPVPGLNRQGIVGQTEERWEISARNNLRNANEFEISQNTEESENNFHNEVNNSEGEALDQTRKDGLDLLWEYSDKIEPFDDENQVEWAKINIHQAGSLPLKDLKSVNSLRVLLSYKKAGYFLWGKAEGDTEKMYLLGVPESYRREDAPEFNDAGFYYFKPKAGTEVEEGTEGYWLLSIE